MKNLRLKVQTTSNAYHERISCNEFSMFELKSRKNMLKLDDTKSTLQEIQLRKGKEGWSWSTFIVF
jgi:hypothetical protein